MAYAARWSDNERRFGPFLVSAANGFRHTAILLNSGDDEDRGCHFRISINGHTLIVALPPILKPWMRWVDLTGYEWASGPGYWDCHPREYGLVLCDGHLSVNYGRQTMDSSTEQSWGYSLPWTQWRHIRHSMYDLSGAHFWTETDLRDFDAWSKAKEACPSVTFAFKDFDSEDIEATTIIEEREWRFGEGKFKWLSLFRKPKVHRYLGIDFSKETGKRKGSWKGGTLGHSIAMLTGELHEAAFRRYCAENNMTFVGVHPTLPSSLPEREQA